ncbi:MAG: cytochrome c biogenesis protein, partial [bacterium]
MHYKAIRDRRGIGRMPVYTAIPRPSSETYIKFSASAMKKIIDGQESALNPLERDTAEALQTYFEDIPKSDRAMPGTQADFDKKFSNWLATRSQWIPLFSLIESDDTQISEAGFDLASAKVVRDSFRKIEAETQNGAISVASAREFADAMRQLGEKAGNYPSVKSLSRESHFNSFAPFFHCPELYGTGLFFLLFSQVFTGIGQTRPGFFRTAGKVTYAIGLFGFVCGILLEIYGFYLRVLISGWAPVTNMYETVIWVALVTAIIGLVLELIYKRIYAATAATGVAMLATLLAANVSLLDPEIKSLQPVLRSNYWLTIHVLTIVSSYAAFALALGLGFIATIYYLTATYRRSPSFGKLLVPGMVGLPVMILGYLAVTGTIGGVSTSSNAYMASFGIAETGFLLTVSSICAVVGEVIARALFKSYERMPQSAFAQMALEEEPDFEEADEIRTNLAGKTQVKMAEKATAVLEPPAPKVSKVNTGQLIKQVRQESSRPVVPTSPRELSMIDTAAKIKPLSNFIYRSMQVGVLLVAAGTILGGVWADYSWGRFWGWDPKEVWA